MGGAVVDAAQDDEVGRRVLATFGAGQNVVHVDVGGVLAARHAAAVLVAMENLAADGRRDGWLGASARVGTLIFPRRNGHSD